MQRHKKGQEIPPRDVFIRAVSEGNTVTDAARAAGVNRATPYRWKEQDPEFGEAWEDARNECVDLLEGEAKRRALAGSDTLLIFLLKSYRPEVFGERVRQTIDQKTEVRTMPDVAARAAAFDWELFRAELDKQMQRAAG